MPVPEFGKAIPHFLSNVLNTPAGALPKGAQWVVAFEDLAGILPAIKTAIKREGKTATDWNLPDQALANVISPGYQETVGCVFCHAIDMPGDSLVVNPEGNIMSNAFLRSYVGQGRNQFPELRMTFLNTNLSFTENFLRPWVLATGQFGLIARTKEGDPERNYRTNAHLYKLGTYSQSDPPYILLKMSFYDLCCVSVSNEEHNYQAASSPMYREAQFVYNYYSIDSSDSFVQKNGTETSKMFLTTNPNITQITKAEETFNKLKEKYKKENISKTLQTLAESGTTLGDISVNDYDKKFAGNTLNAPRDYANQRLAEVTSLSGSKLSQGLNSFSYTTESSLKVLDAYKKRTESRSKIVERGQFYLSGETYLNPRTQESLTFLEYEKLAKSFSNVPSEYIEPFTFLDAHTDSFLNQQAYERLPKQRAKVPSIFPPKDLPYFDLFSQSYISLRDFEVLPKRQSGFGLDTPVNLVLNPEVYAYQTPEQKRQAEERRKRETKAQTKEQAAVEAAKLGTSKPITNPKSSFDKANEAVTSASKLNRKEQKQLNEFKQKAEKIYPKAQADRLVVQFRTNLVQRRLGVTQTA